MLDHLFGRPSANLKRIQTLAALLAAFVALKRPSAPWPLNALNRLFIQLQPWKVVLVTLSGSYFLKHFFLLCFLNEPEPLARMYTRNFYRATWILTALDAGFLTAMNMKPAPLKHIASLLFTLLYLLYPDKAEEKVRKYRAVATYQMMRVSWEKSTNPIIRLITAYDRGWLPIRRNVIFKRPCAPISPSSFPGHDLGDIKARIYFAGNDLQLLNFPGGGFVTMSPENHDDYVSEWARKTKIPILSINYGKSPEFPYPWALEEVYDAYRAIVESNGLCIGFSGHAYLRIVVAGDSAGGNLAVGLILRTMEPPSSFPLVPVPCGVLLMYPCLSMEMACWMPQTQMALLRAESVKSMKDLSVILQAKNHVDKVSPLALPAALKRIDILNDTVEYGDTGILQWYRQFQGSLHDANSPVIRSSLSMTSRMSYFQDRLLAPELMRAMALLYLNGSPIPYSIQEDMYLSPLLSARDDLLENFPPVFFLTGEKDPLVDDTVVFAARIRHAKEQKKKRSVMRDIKPFLTLPTKKTLVDEYNVKVKILEGFSHAFMNMMAFLPETKQAIQLTSDWFVELFGGASTDSVHDLSNVLEEKLLLRRRKEIASQHLNEPVNF